MTAKELKEKFINFFKSKDHQEIPSANLIPENDPTTLFISAGMQQLVPYFGGMKHPLGKRLTDIQKCVRTGDIDEVGDTFHHTFFEMLGNWSLGDYFKKEAIEFSYEFLTKNLKINSQNIFVTCFAGNKNAPKDEVSASVWQSLGIPRDRIIFLEDNWWGPAGNIGPCGPDSEMFIDTHSELPQVDFKTGDKQGRYLEIWNDVFLEYNKNLDSTYSKLIQQNVDTGMGLERTVAVLNGLDDNYLTDIWQPIIKKIEEISNKNYNCHPERQNYNRHPELVSGSKDSDLRQNDITRSFRIIADHIRAAVFIMADGIEPSNKEQGYVLRRLIRRSVRQGNLLGVENNFTSQVAQAVIDNQNNFAGNYPELNQFKEKIISLIDAEETKFRKTLAIGLKEIHKLIDKQKNISGKEAFTLYESFGFPIEMIEEELKVFNLNLNKDEFEKAKVEHQAKSRTLSAGKFKSGLENNSQIITKYHTATHLLHAALRQILGNEVQQAGSNITQDRLRFDFSFKEKLNDAQLKQVQDLVNQKIKQDLTVLIETMPFTEAQKQGALAFFGTKYPEIVSVYTIGSKENYFSKEVCTGPHVEKTQTLGKFKIIKEESAGSGKRRIYAVLE